MKHERFSHPQTSVEQLDANGLRKLDALEWDSLAAEALVENPFYSRQYVLAGLDTVDANAGIRALAIRDRHGELIGLFPYRTRHLPFPTGDASRNVYQPNSTPLVHRNHAEKAIGAWLDAAGPRFWQLAHVPLDPVFIEHFEAALRTRNQRSHVVNAYERPILTRMQGGLEEHLTQVITKSRLKDIRRNLRRLEEQGDVAFEQAREPDLVARRFDQFLAMEHAGWKGDTGTSFLAHEESANFARAAFSAHVQAGLVSIDSLLLDGKPIAMSVNLRARDVAFAAKCAYDENYRRFSPGLVLEYLVIEAFYADEQTAAMDACTMAEGHVISGFWNDSLPMGTLIVGPDDWRTDTLAAIVEQTHTGRERLKRALRHLPLRRWAERVQDVSKRHQYVHWTAGLSAALTVAALYAE